MDRLRPIGFTPAVAQAMGAFNALGDVPGSPMRLIEAHRETVRVTDGVDEHSARPLPGLLRSLVDAGDALTVGDWLWVHDDDHGVPWVRGRSQYGHHSTYRELPEHVIHQASSVRLSHRLTLIHTFFC